MIEEPTKEQKCAAAIDQGARLLADGRVVGTVRVELERRGMTPGEIEEVMEEIEDRAGELMDDRRKLVRRIGIRWLLIGLVPTVGFVWVLAFERRFSFPLALGFIPLAYGIRLLRLRATRPSDVAPPSFHWRN